MLSGKFVNCYGLKDFDLQEIGLDRCNKAAIYAPNGAMKTSLSRVFEDISKGQETRDRIFRDLQTSYIVNYHATTFKNDSLEASDHVYVVNSFAEKFELPNETMSTLLADETTRKTYDQLVSQFSTEIKAFEANIAGLSGLAKTKVKGQLIADLDLPSTADWTDIFENLSNLIKQYEARAFLNGVKYTELFNAKTKPIYGNPTFLECVEEYIDKLNGLIRDNAILSTKFNDHNAEELSKALEKHNLFKANHSILLKDGKTTIRDIVEWKRQVKEQLDEIYNKPEMSRTFNDLKRLLTNNAEGNRLRDIIVANRAIIPYLSEPKALCIQLWLQYMMSLDKPFTYYAEKITAFSGQIKDVYELASTQASRWTEVVNEFNQRFKVPFDVQIANKANYLLKDEALNLYFTYTREKDTESEKKVDFGKDDLMPMLSMGERRAMYLLYILFDLERVKKLAREGSSKYLIVADDIADSFDYKNKYAIIEYLNDLSQSPNIDLIVLTHNFDFYRTIMTRLGIVRENCYIAQRKPDDSLSMSQFKYRNDFFNNVIIREIKDGQIDTDVKKKYLISSIAFYRNLYEYMLRNNEYLQLTCFLHVKTAPLCTTTLKLSDLWRIIETDFGVDPINTSYDELYIDSLRRIAADVSLYVDDEILLENKIVISIAIRLETEIFLETLLSANGETNLETTGNQTRNWSTRAEPYLSPKQKEIVDSVNLMTPESIHLNSFMYEPIIDMSDWMLKELYSEVLNLPTY